MPPRAGVRRSARPASPGLRRTVVAIAAAGALGLSAACSAAGAPGTAAGKDTSFTFWSMWKQDEPQAKVLQAAIDQFTRDTGITVQVQWKGRQVVQQLAPTLNTSNVPADLVDSADRSEYAQLQATGQALDLKSLLSQPIPGESGDTIGGVVPQSYLALTDTGGSQWQIPYEVLTNQVWYNGAALADVAAQPPATWGEFTALLAKQKAARGGAGPLALDADNPDYAAYWTYLAVLRGLGPGAFAKAATDKSGAAFTDPEFVDALNRVGQLVKEGDFASGYNSSKWPAMQQSWAQGKSDFLLMGTWAPSETSPFAAPGFTYRSFPVPALTPGGETTSDVYTIGFSVPKKAKHSAAAEKFITYFLAKSHLAGISTQAKNITSRPDIPAPAELADAQESLTTGKIVETLDGVKSTAPEWYTKVFQPLDTSFIDGKLSAPDFAAKLGSASATYWKASA